MLRSGRAEVGTGVWPATPLTTSEAFQHLAYPTFTNLISWYSHPRVSLSTMFKQPKPLSALACHLCCSHLTQRLLPAAMANSYSTFKTSRSTPNSHALEVGLCGWFPPSKVAARTEQLIAPGRWWTHQHVGHAESDQSILPQGSLPRLPHQGSSSDVLLELPELASSHQSSGAG